LFVISAANSDLYIASRTLYALALQRAAPSIFARTDKRGVPYVALGASALISGLAFMNIGGESSIVFKYLYVPSVPQLISASILSLFLDFCLGSQSSFPISVSSDVSLQTESIERKI
jgi:amino acid permease